MTRLATGAERKLRGTLWERGAEAGERPTSGAFFGRPLPRRLSHCGLTFGRRYERDASSLLGIPHDGCLAAAQSLDAGFRGGRRGQAVGRGVLHGPIIIAFSETAELPLSRPKAGLDLVVPTSPPANLCRPSSPSGGDRPNERPGGAPLRSENDLARPPAPRGAFLPTEVRGDFLPDPGDRSGGEKMRRLPDAEDA